MQWRILDRVLLYQGFFRLERLTLRHALFSGGTGPAIQRELLDRGHAVAILPYDPDRDTVVLIEQFRVGALGSRRGPWLMEVVAGLAEPGEAGEMVAARECQEEAGCRPGSLVHVYDYYSSPGSSSELVSLFVGRVDSSAMGGIHGLAHEGEDIRVRVLLADDAFRLVRAGVVDSAMPIIALQWLQLHRQALRERWLGSPGR